MNELLAPLSVLGLLCTTQSVISKSLFASLEFSYTVLGIACLVGVLFAKKTPKRSHVISLKTLVRGLLVGASVTCWSWGTVRLGAAKSVLVEITILVLLPLIYDQQNGKANNKELPVVAMCALSLLALTISSHSFIAVLAAGLSVATKEMFQLFKDVSSVGMGAVMTLLTNLALHLVLSTGPITAGTQPTSLQWTLASALLWVVPVTVTPSNAAAEEKWFEYSQNKKNRVVFGLGCVTLFALIQKDLHSLSFFASLTAAVGFAVKKRAKVESRSSFLPTTLRDAPTTVDDVDTLKKGGGVLYSTILAQWMQRYSLNQVSHFFREVYADKDSRKILQFLSLTLSFMFVEIFVGLYTGSLGLISDAGHMFFDSAALFIGLFAAFASKWRPDNAYTFGYGRYETLAGFVNAVFLTFVAVFVLTESLERFSEPPEIRTEGLLLTSVLGLVVNGIGLVFFHEHAHSHAGGDDHGHGHSHGGGGHSHSKLHNHSHNANKEECEDHDVEGGDEHTNGREKHHSHSHDGGSCSSSHGHSHSNGSSHDPHGHSHTGKRHFHSHGTDKEKKVEHADRGDTNNDAPTNENMHGVFLHVLADALGSVGVIISSLLIQYKGWHIADPICSFGISVLIFLSVMPLLKSTASSLMLRVPSEAERKFDSLVERCKRRQGVVRVAQAHLWRHSREVMVATANVVVSHKEFQDPTMSWLIASLKSEVGATDVTVQVCTEAVSKDL